MTTIAWDGKILAADKMADIHGYAVSVTKVKIINGNLCFSAGDFDLIQELFAWAQNGYVPSDFPKCDKETWNPFHVIKPDGTILRYERTAYPYTIEEKTFACGSGRDFALAAMYLGKTAIEAVQIASIFNKDTGSIVDSWEF